MKHQVLQPAQTGSLDAKAMSPAKNLANTDFEKGNAMHGNQIVFLQDFFHNFNMLLKF